MRQRVIFVVIHSIVLLFSIVASNGDKTNGFSRARTTYGLEPAADFYAYLPAVFGRPEVPVSPARDWEEVGAGSAGSSGVSGNREGACNDAVGVQIAVAPDGTPYMSWLQMIPDKWLVYVKRWNGAEWVQVSAGSASQTGISGPLYFGDQTMAIAPDGLLYTAWSGYDQIEKKRGVYVKRFNGQSWEEVGSGSSSGEGIAPQPDECLNDMSDVSISVSPTGIPYAVWGNYNYCTKTRTIYVKRWNGALWEPVGDSLSEGSEASAVAPDEPANGRHETSVCGTGFGSRPQQQIEFGPDGTPVLVRMYWEGDIPVIQVKMWNGIQWESVGSDFISTMSWGMHDPDLAISPEGKLHLTFAQRSEQFTHQIIVKTWKDGSWENLGSGMIEGAVGSYTLQPELKFDHSGSLFASWVDYGGAGSGEVFIKRWNGTAWEEIGGHSASDRGVSATESTSKHQTMAFSADGTVYVAWDEHAGGEDSWNTYIRRWRE